MKKWLKWILILVAVLIAGFLMTLLQPWALLPHERIQMSLPFSAEDDKDVGIIPLGEKIEHNASNGTPDGHPGLDFGWQRDVKILAVADGMIMRITKKGNKYNIEQQMGAYRTVYQELNSVESNLHTFSKVKKGQFLGHVGAFWDKSTPPPESFPSKHIHWDFGSASMIVDRLCPENYFDAESKARLEKIWANTPVNDRFKKEYPKICNGIFDGKEEK
jgi:murein DD-endopeptidase MepM/ murein hydrolase activator NlpD